MPALSGTEAFPPMDSGKVDEHQSRPQLCHSRAPRLGCPDGGQRRDPRPSSRSRGFGTFAVALSVWGFCDVVVQFGLRQLIVSRAEEPDAELVAEAAGLSLCIAAVLSGAGLLAVWALAGSLIPIETARALVPALLLLLVSPFTLATEAMLQRSVAFRPPSVREVVRVAVDLAVAVPLALAGFGAVALAGGMFLSHLVAAILLILAADPKMRVWPRLGRTRHFLRWGREMTLIEMVPRLSEIAMISALAAWQGSAALGLFNRARTVHKLLDRTLLEGIKPVILPQSAEPCARGQVRG